LPKHKIMPYSLNDFRLLYSLHLNLEAMQEDSEKSRVATMIQQAGGEWGKAEWCDLMACRLGAHDSTTHQDGLGRLFTVVNGEYVDIEQVNLAE